MKLKSGGPLYGYSPGQSIGTVNVNVSSQQLADMMVGRSVSFKTEKKPAQPKETILSIKDLVVKESRGLDAVKNLSLDVRAGKLLGLRGLMAMDKQN